MLGITPELSNQKCAVSVDDVTPINTTLNTSNCSLCPEVLSGDCKECYRKSTQSNEFPSNFKDKSCQSERYSDQNPHSEKACRFTLEQKTSEEATTEKKRSSDCSGQENGFVEKVCISCRGIDVEIDFQSSDNIYENEIGTLLLDYCFKIKAQKDYQFYVKNLRTNEETSYDKIIGEGSLFLEIPGIPFKYKYKSRNSQIQTTTGDTQTHLIIPDDSSIFNDETVISASSSKDELTSECSDVTYNKEDSCETIQITSQPDLVSVINELESNKDSRENIDSTPQEVNENPLDIFTTIIFPFEKLCSNCSRAIGDENLYLCLFGHDSCKKCKGKPCILCKKMMGEAKAYCKNHHKGCSMLSIPDHLIKHEIDCEFNDFRCPYPRCVFLNSLSDLKLHFLNSHNKNLVQSNNILEVLYGRKDRKWYIYCYDSLFVCSYFYYGTHVEFILQYIGANDKAKCYHFEVEIKTMKDVKLSKKAICAGWNDLSLCKSVYFDYEDLANCDNARFQFTVNLKIINMNNGLYISL